MKLSEHLRGLSADQRKHLAEQCETSVAYLYQIAGGHRTPSLRLIEKIETASVNQVTRYDWPVAKQEKLAA